MYFVVVIVVGCSIMNTIWRYCSVCASLTYLRVLILPQNIGSSVEALAANSKPFSALASVELRAWEHAL